jgi:DNA-binding response OmpR family regulator
MKVLIVADSPTQSLRIRVALEARGFEVVIVNHGRYALATAREEKPDVVLADVRMPGLDGFALIEGLRGDTELAGTPVILKGARVPDEDERELALQAGALDYVPSGLDPQVLAGTLAEAVAAR